MKVTNINDYVETVSLKFPDLTQDEVKRILTYGWKQILLYRSAGNDISVISRNFFMFIGKIPKNPIKMFEKYYKQLSKRIAYMFKRTNSKWDGYYYFSRSEKQYDEYVKLNRKKYKVFKDVFLYKLLEEVKIKDASAPYIFRLSEDKMARTVKYYQEIKTDKAELIIVRDPLTINDLLVSLNKYKYIQ